MKTLTKSSEDYVEALYIIYLRGDKIKSVEVAGMLGVSGAAVNKAMNELLADGLISKENYGEITLTEQGKCVAKNVYKKHKLIYDFLIKLGVSHETADIDCCKIEHIISPETLKAIQNFMAVSLLNNTNE